MAKPTQSAAMQSLAAPSAMTFAASIEEPPPKARTESQSLLRYMARPSAKHRYSIYQWKKANTNYC